MNDIPQFSPKPALKSPKTDAAAVLTQAPGRQQGKDYPLQRWRGPLYCLLVLATTLYGGMMMTDIVLINEANILDYGILALFILCFGWVSTAFWSAIIGSVLLGLGRDPLSLKKNSAIEAALDAVAIQQRTAIVMPIYNEDTARVMAGVEATLRSLAATGQQQHFDFYLLSDSTNKAIASREISAWRHLKKRLDPLGIQLFYRRRDNNSHRKVGNIADFCQRWGHHYPYMVVLDADSIMGGDTLLSLVKRMEANPQAGLIQTVPIPVRQQTLFGRFLQFSAELYCPILAKGNSFWQTNTGNYWGHNAIIRTQAFIECCGLPTLVGRPPFGGEILSHDFVEAALLRRQGWEVLTLTDRVDSYEEVPSNIIDYITRDRRWAQGNIQHLGLLKAKGLHWISRLHMSFGAMAYLSSFLWLLMLVFGTSDAILTALNSNQFFSQPYQLFPNWKIINHALIYSLFGLTIALLLTPKLLALGLSLASAKHSQRHFGGRLRLLLSSVIEIVLSIMIAPMMMIFHAYMVACTLIGIDVVWNSQCRNGRVIPWKEALSCTLPITACALLWGGLSYTYADQFFWWILPVLSGLVLAAAIIRYTSSFSTGQRLQQWGLLSTPSENNTPAVISTIDDYEQLYQAQLNQQTISPLPSLQSQLNLQLPREIYSRMPVQQF